MMSKFVYHITYIYFCVCQFIKINKDALIDIAIYLACDDPKEY